MFVPNLKRRGAFACGSKVWFYDYDFSWNMVKGVNKPDLHVVLNQLQDPVLHP